MLADLLPGLGRVMLAAEHVAAGGRHGQAAVLGLQVERQLALRCGVAPHHHGVRRFFLLQRMGFGHPGLGQAKRALGLVGVGLVGQVELLAGLLSGAGTVRPKRQQGETFAANNLFALVVDPARFADPKWLSGEAGAYIDYLRSCPPQPGFDAVRYPGEYEAAQRARHADAIELDTATAAALRQLADGAGVPFPVLG